MTNEQIKTIHVASSKAGLSKENYRTLLLNVAGVTTSKDLSQEGFEDCMATLEDLGYRGFNGDFYWRNKVAHRGQFANERMLFKIQELHAHYEEARGLDDPHYELSGLVARHSKHRTSNLRHLAPKEAWNLIETLKAIITRITDNHVADTTGTVAESLAHAGNQLPF